MKELFFKCLVTLILTFLTGVICFSLVQVICMLFMFTLFIMACTYYVDYKELKSFVDHNVKVNDLVDDLDRKLKKRK